MVIPVCRKLYYFAHKHILQVGVFPLCLTLFQCDKWTIIICRANENVSCGAFTCISSERDRGIEERKREAYWKHFLTHIIKMNVCDGEKFRSIGVNIVKVTPQGWIFPSLKRFKIGAPTTSNETIG